MPVKFLRKRRKLFLVSAFVDLEYPRLILEYGLEFVLILNMYMKLFNLVLSDEYQFSFGGKKKRRKWVLVSAFVVLQRFYITHTV